MTGREALARLGSDQVVTYPLTIPEGWTFAEMRARLNEADKLVHETAGMSDAEIMAALGRDDEHPEGWFFPDTYRYHKGVTDMEILRRLTSAWKHPRGSLGRPRQGSPVAHR